MYRPSTPVSATAFYDREEELAYLSHAAESLQSGAPVWVAILGRRKVGKTSLLLELARRITAPGMAVVALDSLELSPLGTDVLRRYALRVVESIVGARLGISLERLVLDLPAYRAALVPILGALPVDVARLVQELPEIDPGPATSRLLLDLPERLAEALDLHVLVAWDEFQEVASVRGRKDLVPAMRSAWQRHRRVGYVVSGSERTALEQMVLAPTAPFFQHFAVRELGGLPREDAIRLLVEGAPEERPIERSLAERAADFLDCHPFYLQLLGSELTRGPGPYRDEDLKETVQSLLFSRTGRLSLYFAAEHLRAVGSATTLAATLAAVAAAPRTLSELSRAIRAPTSATSRYLARLGDLVFRREDHWHISDPVFAMWLRWRAPTGAAVPMSVLGDEGERRAAEHLAAIGFDLVYQSRASRGAFDLLATRGAWQLGAQVKRRPLPLRFSASEWARMEAEAVRFGWRWVVVAVSPEDDRVLVLDPALARGRTLREDAAIANVLAWVQR